MPSLKPLLLHQKLLVRFATLFGLVMAVFFPAWILSYLFLPEGILRGRSAAAQFAGNDLAGGSVWLEWLRIFIFNLGALLLFTVAPNLLRSASGLPLGYFTVTVIAAFFAVTLGTNSLTFSLGGKMPPHWSILTSSGLYEIMAYVLASAATCFISRGQLAGKWPKQTLQELHPATEGVLIHQRNLGVILSIMILLFANAWEAYRIAQLFSP